MARNYPPGRVSGSSPEANWLNQLLEYVTSLQPLPSPGVLTDHTIRGVSRRIRESGGSGSTQSNTKQFVLKFVRADYIECLPYTTGETVPSSFDPASLVLIAKPAELRKNQFHTLTVDGISYDVITTTPQDGIRRHATRVSDGAKEIQEVIPHYYQNRLIYATSGIEGGTGVYDKRLDLTPGQSDPTKWLEIEWLEDNRGGRAFAATDVVIPEDGDFLE